MPRWSDDPAQVLGALANYLRQDDPGRAVPVRRRGSRAGRRDGGGPRSGWTPLFLTAGGLVMEMGGANSHGAVVAREYGIPAVVGVPDATLRLHTGDQVTVDGAAGAITVS
jgi:hypothetical protein